MNSIFMCIVCVAMLMLATGTGARERWSAEQANAWQTKTPWLCGSNFTPSTAINELEMWQADSFDAKTIDRELGWAQGLGFNSMRVFLHDLPYEADPDGLLKRLDTFLSIADKHHIGIMFVLFDSCWDPNPKLGPQHDPVKGVHNSGWVQSPGENDLQDPARRPVLEAYVKGVVGRFKDDPRVQVWDIWNEPDNDNANSYGRKNLKEELPNKLELTMKLVPLAFEWSRSVNPSQPLTSGVWKGFFDHPFDAMEKVQLDQSDVISFHGYDKIEVFKKRVEKLRPLGRPILCTEYMARPIGSTFDPTLGYLKEQGIAAYNWGFVAGKTNTIYPWDSWQHPYDAEPAVWFHDIFRADGTAFDQKEIKYIRSVTGK